MTELNLEGFEDPGGVRTLLAEIRRTLPPGREVTLMEVCGTHTMAIARYGLRDLFPPGLRLLSGPGCPVCVTPVTYIDHAIALSRLSEVTLCTFGDLVRVPGSTSSLETERARGADLQIVYSPRDALRRAHQAPTRQVVFLAVGFETTVPTIAATLLEAKEQGLDNFSLLVAHKTIPGPLAVLARGEEVRLDGFLCPGHVSVILGTQAYRHIAEHEGVPCVVAGFAALDILEGVRRLVLQIAEGRHEVENAYPRAVRPEGNPKARQLIDQVFAPIDSDWRGLGTLPQSGLALRPHFASYDAALRFPLQIEPPREPPGCRCGDILCGSASPSECPLFGNACTPQQPRGACMVSSEGSCAAAFRYGS